MVSSSRSYESRRGRTSGFRICSSVLSGVCWIDRAAFAGVNHMGKRLYDSVMLPACRRDVCWCEPHRREIVCWLQVLVSVHISVAYPVLHRAVSLVCLVSYSAMSLVLDAV